MEMNQSFLDLMWTTSPINNHDFPMIALTLKNNKIYVCKIIMY